MTAAREPLQYDVPGKRRSDIRRKLQRADESAYKLCWLFIEHCTSEGSQYDSQFGMEKG